jgi:hypothetical protein
LTPSLGGQVDRLSGGLKPVKIYFKNWSPIRHQNYVVLHAFGALQYRKSKAGKVF